MARSVAWMMILMLLSCSETKLRRLGDSCQQDEECVSSRCDELVCKANPPAAVGEPCSHALECASERCEVLLEGSYCAKGERPIGAACSLDAQCESLLCERGVCQAQSVDSGVDSSPQRDSIPTPDAGPVDSAVDFGSDGPNPDIVDAGPVDASVDSVADGPSLPLNQIWQKTFGGPLYDKGVSVVVDSKGNIYLAGQFYGTVNLGGGNVTSLGPSDIFITSFSADGTHRWQKVFGGTSSRNETTGMAVDINGNVTIIGDFYETAELADGNVTAQGGSDIFISSFTENGTYRWQKILGGSGFEYSHGVVVDSSGSVTLTGYLFTTVDLGGGIVTPKAGGTDLFITSFTVDGEHRWQKAVGGTTSEQARDVAVDTKGNVTVVGNMYGAADLGGGSETSFAGNADIFITSFTSDGVHRWQRALGGSSNDFAYGVAADNNGNITVTGYFTDMAELGSSVITSRGVSDIFVTHFTADGTHRWQKALGGTFSDVGTSLVVDGQGNITITGYFTDTAELGGGSVTSQGLADIFVTGFTSDGVHRWQRALGGTSTDRGNKVAVDSEGNVIIAGTFKDTADLGGSSVTSMGNTDIFLVKFGL
ncbi:MAG: hypothetical protein JRH20_30090 [Deltaproteobacteria bacterium]|nr:hypothetical protein [Deltaproteobacteria bacterium]